MERATERLRAEFLKANKYELFKLLEAYLPPDDNGPPYAETSTASGMTEGAVKVAVHRLRRRYDDLLREEVAQTVGSPEEVEDESRHLTSAIRR
jgi:RNA polymerase sigma-70 factor (ECF subfamily)